MSGLHHSGFLPVRGDRDSSEARASLLPSSRRGLLCSIRGSRPRLAVGSAGPLLTLKHAPSTLRTRDAGGQVRGACARFCHWQRHGGVRRRGSPAAGRPSQGLSKRGVLFEPFNTQAVSNGTGVVDTMRTGSSESVRRYPVFPCTGRPMSWRGTGCEVWTGGLPLASSRCAAN